MGAVRGCAGWYHHPELPTPRLRTQDTELGLRNEARFGMAGTPAGVPLVGVLSSSSAGPVSKAGYLHRSSPRHS